ncbi:MAG: oxidoreductase [bacterium]|nr:oxidoreductase [bacterium]
MAAKSKPSLAVYGAGSCGGCEVCLLNIGERLLTVKKVFDIVFFPFLEDFKRETVAALPDNSIDLCLFNGCMRTSQDEEMARLLRGKAKLLLAFGSCAHEGCIPGLANLSSVEDILKASYLDNPSTENPDRVSPLPISQVAEGELALPVLSQSVRTLDSIVEVDYTLPGCPPEPEQVWTVLEEFVSVFAGGTRPPAKGSVLGAKDFALCDECPLERRDVQIDQFVRPHQIIADPDHCLLEQGIVCLGVATRAGCGALCPSVAMGCRGCYGTPPCGDDQGARVVAALSSVVGVGTVEDDEADIRTSIETAMATLVDPAATFYRFSLARSLLHRARILRDERGDA